MSDATPAPEESADASAESPSFDDMSFEEALDRLESIVETLEDDPPALDEAIDVYEEGVGLAKRCLSRLNDAEQRISELDVDLEE